MYIKLSAEDLSELCRLGYDSGSFNCKYYFILCVLFLIQVITSYVQLNCDVLNKGRLYSNEKKLTIAMHKDKSHNHNIA